jgi:AcrR family transcriptional regulator
MASAGAVTCERILEQGLELMSRNGLGGVTLGVLADQVGMSKSGLFAHFKSKDEVQIGLLEHTVKVGEQQIIAPAMRSPEGLPRLKALMKYWLGWTKRAGLPGGCPVAAAMFELDDVDGPVRDWVLAQERRWCDFLRHNVEQAVTRGQLQPDLDAEQFVWEMCGIYLAHHVAYRFRKARDADQRAETAFEALLARALREEKAGKSKRKAQAADRTR